jgi:hypothetical protein
LRKLTNNNSDRGWIGERKGQKKYNISLTWRSLNNKRKGQKQKIQLS